MASLSRKTRVSFNGRIVEINSAIERYSELCTSFKSDVTSGKRAEGSKSREQVLMYWPVLFCWSMSFSSISSSSSSSYSPSERSRRKTSQRGVSRQPASNYIACKLQHIELPAKLPDNFLRSNQSNINQFRRPRTHQMWEAHKEKAFAFLLSQQSAVQPFAVWRWERLLPPALNWSCHLARILPAFFSSFQLVDTQQLRASCCRRYFLQKQCIFGTAPASGQPSQKCIPTFCSLVARRSFCAPHPGLVLCLLAQHQPH